MTDEEYWSNAENNKTNNRSLSLANTRYLWTADIRKDCVYSKGKMNPGPKTME